MRVLVTGGTGNVGRAAVARLVRNGHTVRVIGRRTDATLDHAEYRSCDITDYHALCDQVKGMEAVVHLAAIRHPSLADGQEIFRVNCSGTFNVYRAAAEQGMHRVVTASSINALGYNFGTKSFPLRYFPVDEEHPSCTTDPYSFSKQILEEIAAYFWRREGISGICMRLPAVYEAIDGERGVKTFVMHARDAYTEFFALPIAERQTRAQQVIARFEALRIERAWEVPSKRFGLDQPDAGLMFGRSNFWTSIHAEDSAQAIEKGLLAKYDGSHVLYVNDSHNFAGVDTESLASTFFPEVTSRKRSVVGTESLVSIDRARALIGFEPQHSIQQWVQD